MGLGPFQAPGPGAVVALQRRRLRQVSSIERRAAGTASTPVAADPAPELVEAVLAAARVLVGISAQSVAAVDDVVTLPQLRVLMMVANRGALNLSAVAAGLGVHPSNGTRVVDRLVTADLISRRDNPADRRNLLLELTPAGRTLVDTITSHRRDAVVELLRRVPHHQWSDLGPALHSFAAAGGEVTDDPAWSLGWTLQVGAPPQAG